MYWLKAFAALMVVALVLAGFSSLLYELNGGTHSLWSKMLAGLAACFGLPSLLCFIKAYHQRRRKVD